MQETERELKLVFRNRSDVPDTEKFMSVALKILLAIDTESSLRLDSVAKTRSVYWDTKDFKLAREGLALRVRTVDGRRVVTLKTESIDDVGVDHVLPQRSEFHRSGNELIEGNAPDPYVFLDCPVGARLLAVCGNEQLGEAFASDIMRRTFRVESSDGCRMAMMLDDGNLFADRASERVMELEIELCAGPSERLYEVALALVEKLRLAWSGASKFQRGILLADGPALDPPRPALSAVPMEQSMAGSLSAALREGMGRAVASCMRFDRDPGDPESIHNFRVDLRHVRSIVDFARPLLKDETYEKMRRSLRSLFRPTSGLREADMLLESWRLFCEDTVPPERQGNPDRLEIKLCRHRKHCLERVRKNRMRTRWSRALLVLSSWTSLPQHLVVAVSAQDYANSRLDEMEQEVLRHATSESLNSPQEYHALRIQVKRLRMIQTVFRPDDASIQPRWDAGTLKRMQDALGDLHDAHVNLEIASSLLGGRKRAETFLSWLSDRCDRLQEQCVQILDASVRA